MKGHECGHGSARYLCRHDATAVLGRHVAPAGGKATPGLGWLLTFAVDDVRAARGRVLDGGGKASGYHDIPGGVILEITDPEATRSTSRRWASTALLTAES